MSIYIINIVQHQDTDPQSILANLLRVPPCEVPVKLQAMKQDEICQTCLTQTTSGQKFQQKHVETKV